MTPLGAILRRRIARTGPMTLAEYMAECLLHPDHGYYATRDPFGQAGDFITAPEISQMFGELLGLWLAQTWMDQGAPSPFTLAEAGPGRGTLMADILRATRGVPGFHQAMRVVLVEASPTLRAHQRQVLAGWPVEWVDEVADLPDAPLWLVANEFFDALPIRQFRRAAHGWAEVLVSQAEGRLAFALTDPTPLAALAHRLADTREGEVVETCAPATAIAAEIGARISARGGAALIVDYGGWHSRGDTFQALKDHAPVDPLSTPGEADLTAHVDFEALAGASGLRAYYTTQGAFLSALGIRQRAEVLARGMEAEQLASHLDATDRLTAPARMGSLFKTLALMPETAPRPPGFDAARP